MRPAKETLASLGYAIVQDVVPASDVQGLLACVRSGLIAGSGVMRSHETYAIRRALQVMPGLQERVWTTRLKDLVRNNLSEAAFVTKSIWFEKPPGGNWFVGWHQDISISVARRIDVPGYSRWTAKHGVIGVVPPLPVLQHTLTVRIHLDDADGENGAVRVMPGSHRDGILAPPAPGTEGVLCSVPAGGVMLMRPLLMHASSRSGTERPRRVLHIEFNEMELDNGIERAERMAIPKDPG